MPIFDGFWQDSSLFGSQVYSFVTCLSASMACRIMGNFRTRKICDYFSLNDLYIAACSEFDLNCFFQLMLGEVHESKIEKCY